MSAWIRRLVLRWRRGYPSVVRFHVETVETGRYTEVVIVGTGERFLIPEKTVRIVEGPRSPYMKEAR